MSLSIKLLPEPVRTLAFGGISGTYAGVGAPLRHPSRLILFQNFTDANLMLSFDGTDDHVPLAADGFVLLDITANKSTPQGFYIAVGTRFYIKEIDTPSLGSVYISTFYGLDT